MNVIATSMSDPDGAIYLLTRRAECAPAESRAQDLSAVRVGDRNDIERIRT